MLGMFQARVTLEIDGNIIEVYDDEGEQFPDLSITERKLKHGWRTHENGALFTIMPGSSVEVTIDDMPDEFSYSPLPTFNDLTSCYYSSGAPHNKSLPMVFGLSRIDIDIYLASGKALRRGD